MEKLDGHIKFTQTKSQRSHILMSPTSSTNSSNPNAPQPTGKLLAGSIRHRLLLSIDPFKVQDKVMLGRALTLAEEVHVDELRKPARYTPNQPAPYIVHPMRVAMIIVDELELKEPVAVAAALLHDVVESSRGRVSIGTIEENFGRAIAMMVSILSKPQISSQATQIERDQKLNTYHDRISHSSVETKLVKLASRLDNVREARELADKRLQQAYLDETRKVFVPIAENTDNYLHDELIIHCQRLENDIKFG